MSNLLTLPRKTFAIISHPDAGKTTVTEKLLLFGGAIQLAGTVKGRRASRHATSDWMEMEKERGISVTTSVMQFPFQEHMINLLDTPGHADFSEDTYRTLTAVDSVLMVIDLAKGVEDRTIKLMDVCRLRDTPIMTFINKLDREGRDPIEVLDEIESVLSIQCAPVTWPIGMGKSFKGIYHIYEDKVYHYQPGKNLQAQQAQVISGIDNPLLDELMGDVIADFREELELVRGASHAFNQQEYLAGKQTPVYFGSAINNFGMKELLSDFVKYAPGPQPRAAKERNVAPSEASFTGFVFKIQANMDPKHRDRIAFFRICSGQYTKGMRVKHLRIGKDVQINNAVTFMAGQRENLDVAYPGDIIGLHNHGTIQIGDTLSEGEQLKFTGIPSFAPTLYRRVILKDPLKQKSLLKGITQLTEEGATQLFRPVDSNELILGAIGTLQFDVVAYRLKSEYGVECVYDHFNVGDTRWVSGDDPKMLKEFQKKEHRYLALDGADHLCFLSPTSAELHFAIERWPKLQFTSTREH